MHIPTKMWKIDSVTEDEGLISEAAEQLRLGHQIAFPTETVYGLGADARSDEAVKGIFRAKGRPSDNPLIVHIHNINQAFELVDSVNTLAMQLMERFWPGPLTIVLPVKQGVLSQLVTAGLQTVGIRMPDHQLALKLIEAAGCPIAAPSANTSGRPSPTLATHVYEDLNGKITGIVDGGPTGVGLESTVVEVIDDTHIHILRPGGVTIEQLQQCSGEVHISYDIELKQEEAPRSPGMKYTHYAPQGKLVVVQGEASKVTRYIVSQLEHFQQQYRCGVLYFEEHADSNYHLASLAINLGSIYELENAAARLYDALRTFDSEGIQYIWSEASALEGIGAALMNRLLKAAGHTIVQV